MAERHKEPIRLRWEGAQFSWHSLAHVNRELCHALLNTGQTEICLWPTEDPQFGADDYPRFNQLKSRVYNPLSGPAHAHIRHHFPPRFEPPDEGRFVLIQPWEYGFLPMRWIEPIERYVHEVWCYSKYVKDVYIASGIDPGKLHVVPLGVDTNTFTPAAPPYVITIEPGAARVRDTLKDRFIFLYVGGTLNRKGADILLNAYLGAFSAYDDVCLLIKDTGTKTVYYGQNERERILSLVNDHTRPPIVYLEDDLSAHQLAGVYTASHCLVQPYRGEGFCLPALEAMAGGIPVLVPAGGPTDDFVDETVGWRLPAEKKPYGNGRIGDLDCVGPTWAFEIAVDTLAKAIREVYNNREEVRRRGSAARERVQEQWAWKRSGEAALERLEEIAQLPLVQNERPVFPSDATAEQVSAGKVTGKRSRHVRKEIRRKPELRKPPAISLCMIVKNEERVLDACLTSIEPWVDEIVVVDTGSTDKTVQIAERHNVKLHTMPWPMSFSIARNRSIDQATGDWILWMDADDTIPEECGRELRDLVFFSETRTTGFIMQVHIPPPPNEFGFTIVDHVKLFRNHADIRFEGRIHEQIMEPIYKHGGNIMRSNLHVVHSGYDHSPEGQRGKRERDMPLLLLDIEDRPDHPFPWFNLGMTHNHLGNYKDAIPALEKSMALSKPFESTVRKLYAMLVNSYWHSGEQDAARANLEAGLSKFPNDPELLFRAAQMYHNLGDPSHAEQMYLKLLSAREIGHIDSLDVSMTTYKALQNLGMVYMDMGRTAEAERCFLRALEHYPQFIPAWHGLADLHMRQQRFGEVRSIMERVAPFCPDLANYLHNRLAELQFRPQKAA